MNKMRGISVILLVFSMTITAVAQNAAYRRLMNDRNSMDLDVFIAELKDYQLENPTYGNVYVQLGNAELSRFSGLDPITERTASRQYIYNAKTNFGLATNYIDEKDIARNPDWYGASDANNRDSVVLMGKGNCLEIKFLNPEIMAQIPKLSPGIMSSYSLSPSSD